MTLSRSTAAVVALLCVFVIAVDFQLVGLASAGGMFNMLAALIATSLAALFVFSRGTVSVRRLQSKPVVVLGAFLVWGTCSLAWSANIGATTTTVLAWLMGLATLYLLAGLAVGQALASMVIALTLLCSAGLVFALVSPEAFMFNQGMMRFRGLFAGPHSMSGPVSLGLVLLATGRVAMPRWARNTAFVVLAICLILTLSRQAYAAVLLGISAAFYLRGSAWIRSVYAVVLVIAFAAGGLVMLMGDQRALEISVASQAGEVTTLTGRTEIWDTSIALIKTRPMTGYGWGAGGDVLSSSYATEFGWTTTSAHSAFLQTGLDLGVPGMVLLLMLVLYAARNAIRFDAPLVMPVLICVLAISVVERGLAGAGSFISVVFLYFAVVLGPSMLRLASAQPDINREFVHAR